MNKYTLVAAGVAVLLMLAFFVGLNFNNQSPPQPGVNAISTSADQTEQPEQPSAQAGLSVEIQCSDAAKTFFDNWKSDASASNNWAQAVIGSGGTLSYDNHFNKALGKCFIRIRGVLNDSPPDGDYYRLVFAYDVYENKLTGYSNSPSNPNKGIFLCEFPSNKGACAKEADFENALAPYFNN